MATTTKKNTILGIGVGTRSIDAVLIERDGTRYTILGQFTKARVEGESTGGGEGEMNTLIPGLKSEEDADYTLEIGGRKQGSSDLFLASELEDLGISAVETGEQPEVGAGKTTRSGSPRFETQFNEILSEARAVAGEITSLAICASAPDVDYRIVTLDSEATESTFMRKRSRKSALVKKLAAQIGSEVDAERVGYLELTGPEQRHRYLTVIRDERDAVLQTIRVAQAIDRTKLPGLAAIDSELSLMAAMVSRSTQTEAGGNAAFVRVGSEDTLIAFLSDGKLSHFDWLRSVNIYDAPETVCSRVLLQQDEKKIGEIDTVYVLANSRSDVLHKTFSRYYPDASVLHLERLLIDRGLELDERGEPLRTGMALAAAIAVSIDERALPDVAFVNLSPEKLVVRRRSRIAFAWHTYLTLPVLFLVTFFFVFRYLQNEVEIDARRTEVMTNPHAPPVTNPAVLQARVDSLEQAYLRYTRGLTVLDSLLLGSDKWSRFLERVTQSTRALSGVWLTGWSPSGNTVTITGMALSRSRVSQFARRLDAVVESVSSQDIRDADKEVRVYDFTIVADVPNEMPEVAKYLQEQPIGDPEDENGTSPQ